MKKRGLSLFMVLVLCLTLLPTAAFAEGEDVSISGGVIGGGETGGEGGGIYVDPGSPTEGGGGTYIPGKDTRTEIWCVSKPDSIGRGYDGTTDGSTIPINLTFTDGTNTIVLTEGTGFTAKKTFDSADAGWHTVTVEIALIGEAAVKYKLKAGEETFTIGGNINKAYPDLTVSLSKTACTAGEKLLPLLSVEGAPEDAEVTYYYLASALKSWAGSSDVEGSEAMPKIDENTAISEPGTYYVYAKTAKTTNYEEHRSATVALTVTEPAAASVTKADGTVSGTYKTLPAALNAAQDGDTVKLLADHTTNWSNVEAGEEQMAVVKTRITLDLNGHTVDYLVVGEVVPDEEGGILETFYGNLTVVDNIQGGSHGKIKDLEFVKGSLAIQGGQIGDSDGGLTCNVNSGNATISGGTVLGLEVSEGATVTVNGGTVLGLKVSEGATVTVNDGSAHAGAWLNEGTLNITGGTFGDVIFRNNGGTIAISGGTFDTITNTNGSGSIPLMPLLADNYAFYQGDNAQNSTEKKLTNVTVRPHTHSFENGKCDCGMAAIVVDNNNSCYSTLQAALNAAANDASITSVTLGQDLTEDVTFNRAAAGALTLNMNGHKLEATAGVPLTVIGGELIIEGAGQVNQNTASNATTFPAISLTGGKLVIKDGLSAQGGYDSSNGRKPAIYATDGELDLQGNVSLNGGLTITGTAKLTNLLTQGTFFAKDPDGQPTTGKAIAVSDGVSPSENYTKAVYLLKDGHAFYRAENTPADAGGVSLNLTPAATAQTFTIGTHTCRYSHNETFGIAYCACGRSHAHRDLSDEKSVLVNGVCPICGYHCPHNTVNKTTLSCSDCGAKVVAKVEVEGSEPTYAFDLASAFQNAVNGTTITLLANGMLPSDTYVSKTLTLDLDGHSLSGYSLNVGGLTVTSQVRTGKLTVIDSSGGNGAVGVTVREGGTLVFDPKNDHTTLLRLEVWGGTVELYGGKISRSGLQLNNNITLGNLLPGQAGLAYYRGDTQLTLEEAASQTCDLVVKLCSHGGKNGFDGTNCPYCNAPAVAETALNNGEGNSLGRRFANLQTAIDADRDGGATLQLLADVTGDYTINGTQDTGLNLNGHSIKGTVTVKAAAGSNTTTTLSNTKNTTTASIDKVVAHKGAKLAGSGSPAVIGELTLADGATWKNILNLKTLGYKVLNGDGTYQWYAPDDINGSQLSNVIIQSLPITSKTLNLKVDGNNLTVNSPKVERGTTVQLCASCNAKDVTVTFSILKTGETTPITLTEPSYAGGKYTKDYSFDTIGEYTIYFTATKDGYSVTSSHKKLTVTKADIKSNLITPPTAQENLTYTGREQALIIAGSVDAQYGEMQYRLGTSGSFSTAIPTATGAGTYTVYYKVVGAEGYNDTTAQSIKVTISPVKIKGIGNVASVSKTYDGSASVTLPKTNLEFLDAAASKIFLPESAYTITDARFTARQDNFYEDSPNAGTKEAISFTLTLTDSNYVFEGEAANVRSANFNFTSNDDRFQINQATVTPAEITQLVFNDLAKTYTIDLAKLLPKLSEGCAYGSIQYQGHNYNFTDNAYLDGNDAVSVSKEGVLTLSTVAASTAKVGDQIGTITVPVVTTNYQKFEFTIKVYISERIPPNASGVTVSASEITYGQMLNESKLTATGTMKHPGTGEEVKGTFAWTNPEAKPGAAGDSTASWTFTPAAGYEEYAPATGTVTIKVNKATPTFTAPTAQENLTYTGQEQALITAGSVTSGGTMQYSLTKDGTYSQDIPTGTDAGEYTVWYRVIGDANHNDTAPASVAIRIGQKPLTITGVTAASKPYDGTTDAGVTSVTFDNVTLTRGTDYTVTASFDDAGVGNGKNITATVTLMEQAAKNYALEQSSFPTTGSIIKAAAPDFTKETALVIVNGHEKTYTVTLPALPTLETPKAYGALTYEIGEIKLNDGYYTSGAKVENGELTLPIQKNDVETTGSVGTVTVVIKSANYEDITLTVNVSAKNRITPTGTPTLSKNAIIYGDALNTIALSGKLHDNVNNKNVEGMFMWADGTVKPSAGSYEAAWKFTPTDGGTYAETTGTVTITVNKAKPTGDPIYTRITAAKKTLADANLKSNTSWPTGTIQWMDKDGKELPDTTEVKANTAYKWIFTPGAEFAANYTTATGELTLYSVSTGGGGGGGSSSGSTVKTDTVTNPDGSVTKTETKSDGTVVETTTGKDGIVSKTTTNPNGSSVTETKAADGSTGTVKTDKHGQTTAETTLSSKAIEDAKRNGEPVKAPVEVKTSRNSNTAPTVKVELPKGTGETKVEIPVSNATPGTVAVLVHADGTEEIVKNSLPTEDGIQLTVNGGATVKIVDNSKDFADTRNHWAKDAIDFVSARGLVNGMSATIYAPNNSTTRAQLWTILARQADADLTGGATWFENAQNWAKAKGVSDGANPNAAINRAQMVTMLWRAVGQPVAGSTANFADVSADAYYASAVAWAVENGITTGVGNGKFDPNATCTRGQIATFLYRAFNK